MSDVHFNLGAIHAASPDNAKEVTAMQGATAITVAFLEKQVGQFLGDKGVDYEKLATFIGEAKKALRA